MQIDEYKLQLVSKILLANSIEDARKHIDNTIEVIEKDSSKENLLHNFLDKIAFELDSFNPIETDNQQWSNITFARIYFYRTKRDYKKNTV